MAPKSIIAIRLEALDADIQQLESQMLAKVAERAGVLSCQPKPKSPRKAKPAAAGKETV